MHCEMPIRVLIAMDQLGYGDRRYHGAGRLIVEWSSALRDRGVDVITVVLRAPREFEVPADLQISFFDRGRYDIGTLADFRRIYRQRRIQVTHLQGFGSLTFGRIAARTLGIPMIAHIHANHLAETGGYPWFVRLADRLLAGTTTKGIAVSEATARFAMSYQGFRASQIEVWRNSVDLSRYRPPSPAERADVRRELNVPLDVPVVITVARMDHVKGLDILVEAWPSVVRQTPSAHLIIVGDGSLRDDLVSRVASHGLMESVHFLGYRTDVPRILHAADILALPSRSEGLPLAGLEALASGLPVVAHAVGGVPDLVVDGENGRLVPPRPETLAEALIELVSDGALRERLARGARPSVEGLGVQSYAERLERLYRSVIAGTCRTG